MPEKLMPLDEIKAASRDGRWHDALCSLVEHVRRLTPEPASEPPPCASRSESCACPMGANECAHKRAGIRWGCEKTGVHHEHAAFLSGEAHPAVWWTDADPVARPAPVVEPPACEVCGGRTWVHYRDGRAQKPWQCVGACEIKPCPSCRPAPVSPRAEADAGCAAVRVAGRPLLASSKVEQASAVEIINAALADAEERGKALGFEAGRRKGLEEAAEFVRTHDVGFVQVGFRGGRFEAVPVSDITPQRMTLAAAIRSLIGGDK